MSDATRSAQRIRLPFVLAIGLLGGFGVMGWRAAQAQSTPLPFLLHLSDNDELVSVHYTPGSLDRAVTVQERFKRLIEEFESWAKQPSSMVVFLLNRQEWIKAVPNTPYGIPDSFGINSLVLAAWGDSGTVEVWQKLVGRDLPPVPGTPMRGTLQEVATLGVGDIVAQVKAARGLLASAGIYGDQTWIEPFLAHLVASSASQIHEGARMPQIDRFWLTLSQRGGGAGARSLSGYTETPSPAERLWFEAQFHEGARIVAAAGGKQAPKKILRAARKNGGRVDASDLVGQFPELGRWLKTSFRAESPASR